MIKKTLSKIVGDADLREGCLNFALLYGAGVIVNVTSNLVFDFNLNVYHSVEHLAIGAGGGTFAYRKSGGGFKGVVAGLTAATLYNIGWEFLEPSIPNYNGESLKDTLLDIAMIYAGSALSFLWEKKKAN